MWYGIKYCARVSVLKYVAFQKFNFLRILKFPMDYCILFAVFPGKESKYPKSTNTNKNLRTSVKIFPFDKNVRMLKHTSMYRCIFILVLCVCVYFCRLYRFNTFNLNICSFVLKWKCDNILSRVTCFSASITLYVCTL